jgi:hypothetical protein
MDLQKFRTAAEIMIRTWLDAKASLEESVPFDAQWLHLIAGPLVLLAAARLMRRPLSNWLPWLVVVAFGGLNEIIDLSVKRWPLAPRVLAESIKDFSMTMALPTLIVVVAGFMRLMTRETRGQPR